MHEPEGLLDDSNTVRELLEVGEGRRGVAVSTKDAIELSLRLLDNMRVEEDGDEEPQDSASRVVRTRLEGRASD